METFSGDCGFYLEVLKENDRLGLSKCSKDLEMFFVNKLEPD